MACSQQKKTGRVHGFAYNPFEIAIHAPTHELRGRLAARAGSFFATEFSIGHVIERTAVLESETVQHMGVSLIRGGGQHGLLYPSDMDDFLSVRQLLDTDIVFIESEIDNHLPKLVWVQDGVPPAYEHVLAYVGNAASRPSIPPHVPYFTESQTLPLKQHVREYFLARISAAPLYGLVLTGGKSTRMGEDKGGLSYQGLTQVARAHGLLSAVCDDVFVSLREEQSALDAYKDYAQIHDTFLGLGPLGGILSAQKAHPGATWFVLACDLPYATIETMELLVSSRNPFKLATAYISAHDGLPEPLCALYEPKSVFRLMQFLAHGYHCPRKALINSDTWLLHLEDSRALDNVNTPAERQIARETLTPRTATT